MDDKIIEILKGLIEKKGPEYIKTHPYDSYKALIKASDVDRQVAGGVLLCLLGDIPQKALTCPTQSELAGIIGEECSFSDRMSARLASLFLSLYSQQNRTKWSKDEEKGRKEFLSKESEFSWEGFSTWEAQNIYVDCHYNASFVLKPSSLAAEDKGLRELLAKNPFLSCDEISGYFDESLRDSLDDAFVDYCTAEEYYEPVPEDFECESYLNDWCKKHGFEIVSFEGKGYDDGIQSWR